jgi:hypothetical protein
LPQTLLLPLIVPGDCMDVLMLAVIQVAEEVMLQELVAVTQMLPPPVPLVTVMEEVVCPEVITHPDGTVHV